MAVTLAQAKLTAGDDISTFVIDEFRKSSYLLNALPFDPVVNSAGAGATLTYGYTRLTAERAAAFRAINAEYTPAEATIARYTVDLKPLGGSFQIDRVLDAVAAASQTALQMSQLIKASSAKFADAVVNGDTAVDANGFDGLSKSLTGSTTEYLPLAQGTTLGYRDWTTVDTKAEAVAELEQIDAWLALMDRTPDVIIGPAKGLSMFKRLAIWADQYGQTADAFGRPINTYNGIPLVDVGAIAGASTAVIPLVTRDTDAGGAGGNITNLADFYAISFGMDAFHGVSMAGRQLVNQWLPDFTRAGAVKTGEVELGPVAVVLKATKAAGVLRNVKVQ